MVTLRQKQRASVALDKDPLSLDIGGEGEIRTLGTSFPIHSLSRRAPSATRSLLHNFFGGGGRIRTHEALTPNGFQDRRLQPLGHSSKINPRNITPWRRPVN